MASRRVAVWRQFRFSFLGLQNHCGHWLLLNDIRRRLLLGRKAMTNLDSWDIILPTKAHIVKTGFSSSHVEIWELNHKEGWVLKNWYFKIVVMKKTLESSLDCKEIKLVNSKGKQPWICIGRTVVEAEALILWPHDARVNSLDKTLMLGKIEDKRRRGQQRMRWLDNITDSMDMNLSKLR